MLTNIIGKVKYFLLKNVLKEGPYAREKIRENRGGEIPDEAQCSICDIKANNETKCAYDRLINRIAPKKNDALLYGI